MTSNKLEDALRKLIEHAHLHPADVTDNESAMYDANLQEACRTVTEWIISAQPQPTGECPECHGVGMMLGHDRDGYVVERACLTCKGTGTQRVLQPEVNSE